MNFKQEALARVYAAAWQSAPAGMRMTTADHAVRDFVAQVVAIERAYLEKDTSHDQ